MQIWCRVQNILTETLALPSTTLYPPKLGGLNSLHLQIGSLLKKKKEVQFYLPRIRDFKFQCYTEMTAFI